MNKAQTIIKYAIWVVLALTLVLAANIAWAETRMQLTLTLDKPVTTIGQEFYYLTLNTDYVPGRVALTVAGKLSGNNGSLSLDGSCILTTASTYSCRFNVDGARFKIIIDPSALAGQVAGYLGRMNADFKVQDEDVRILTLYDKRVAI